MITAEMTSKKSFQPQVENEPCVMYSFEPIEKDLKKVNLLSFSTAQDDAKNPGKMTTFVCANQNEAIWKFRLGSK